MNATNKEDALKELKEIIVGTHINNFCDGMNRRAGGIDRVTLYEVSSSEEMPIQTWVQEVKDIIETAKKQEAEDAERKEFERLSQKFGNK